LSDDHVHGIAIIHLSGFPSPNAQQSDFHSLNLAGRLNKMRLRPAQLRFKGKISGRL
jgi:hypothetical protein